MEDVHKTIEELRLKAQKFLQSIGKQILEIFRIEKLKPKPVPTELYGEFYQGDSYVILKKTDNDDYDIHYWHGKDASMDEETCAAALSVQISDTLLRPCRHHLELQGEESQLFLSYFKNNGVIYLEGGIESGLKHTREREHHPRLLQIKGKRYPRVWTYTPSADIIHEGDVFILDNKSKLYLWEGKESNSSERIRALAIMQHIKEFDYCSRAKIYYPRDDEDAAAEFWEALGGKPESLAKPTPDNFESEENKNLFEHKFFKVIVDGSENKFEEITKRPLKKKYLDTNDVFILELEKGIYVWCGKKADFEEQKQAFLIAKTFKENREKEGPISIVKIPESGEDAVFKSYFSDFYGIIGVNIPKNVDAKEQIEKLYQKCETNKFESKDEPAKSLKVYIVEEDKLTEIPEHEQGYFYDEDIYVIDAFNYHSRHYLYLWVGKKKTFEDIKYCDKYFEKLGYTCMGDDIIIGRIRRSKETASFLYLFKSGVVIMGGQRSAESEQNQIFTVYSPFNKKPKAIELSDISHFYFNSGNVYYFVQNNLPSESPRKLYKWIGSNSNQQERDYNPHLLFENKEIIEINEGEESNELWQAFFNQPTRPDSIKLYERKITDLRAIEPRLFLITNETGYFTVEEILDFGQEDLDHGDVMILDAYDTIFVWIGRESNMFEKRKSMDVCEFYINMVIKNGRENNINLTEVIEGNEPNLFKSYFPDWNDDNLK